jgi:hypothetical protein
MTSRLKKLLIECHPDRHGGDHSRMEEYFRAAQRPRVGVFRCVDCSTAVSRQGTRCGVCFQAKRRLKKVLPVAALLLLLCALCASVANAQPSPPKTMAAAVVAPKPVTLKLAWDAYNPEFLVAGSTNTTFTVTTTPSSNGAITNKRVTTVIINDYTVNKPATNYTLWNGTNLAASTTGLTATVSYPRGATPTFALQATTADGQTFGTGTFAMPKNPQASALVSVWVETATTLNGSWVEVASFSKVVEAAQLAAPSGFFRARLNLQPLGTNAGGFAFTPNVFRLTNAP